MLDGAVLDDDGVDVFGGVLADRGITLVSRDGAGGIDVLGVLARPPLLVDALLEELAEVEGRYGCNVCTPAAFRSLTRHRYSQTAGGWGLAARFLQLC